MSSTIVRVRVTACAIILVIASSRLHADRQYEVVRSMTPALTEALDALYRNSATGRSLVDELERSDLIIHVRGMGLDLKPRFLGTMRFVHTAGGRRFLRISVNERLPLDRRAAGLAHELQHALEVARAPWVIDRAGLSTLYQRIGYQSGDDPNAECYETADALRVGARALAEFRAIAANSRQTSRNAVNGPH